MNAELLDLCLDRIQSQEGSLQDCLQEFPEQAPVLASLLRTAALARQSLAPAGLSEAFAGSSRIRIEARIRSQQVSATAARRPAGSATWRPAPSLASALIALGLLVVSFGAAYAAGDSLPGDPLYGVKRGLERAALAINPTARGDTGLLLRFAQRRLDEAERLAALGREDDLETALEAYEATVDEALAAAGVDSDSLGNLGIAMDAHEEALLRVLAKAPEAARPAISGALDKSRQTKTKIDHTEPGRDPDKNSPGQSKKTLGADLEEDKPPRVNDKTPKPPKTPTPAG